MWARIVVWAGTKTGRTVLMALALALGLLIGWWAFSRHYYNKGLAECQAARLADTNAANVARGEANIANNAASSDLAQQTQAQGSGVVENAAAAAATAKETVNDVYKKPPTTAPIAFGSCVHPLDQRVQDRISQARSAAVEARSP